MEEQLTIVEETPPGTVNIYTTEPWKRIVQAYRNRIGACNRKAELYRVRTLILNKVIDIKSVTRDYMCHKQGIKSKRNLMSMAVTKVREHKPEVTSNHTIIQLYGYEDDLDAIIKKLPLRKSRKFKQANYFPIEGNENMICLSETARIEMETIKDPIRNTKVFFDKSKRNAKMKAIESKKEIRKIKSSVSFDFDHINVV